MKSTHNHTSLSRWLLALVILPAFLWMGCDSTEPDEEPDDEELITRVVLTLSTPSTTTDVVAVAENSNGLANGELTVDTLRIVQGALYTGKIELYNTIDSENVTLEIDRERDSHQFFYTMTGDVADQFVFNYTDKDAANLPVGLIFTLQVNAGGEGTLRIQLGHYDEVQKDGVMVSDETDIDFEMPVKVTASA